jgi:hypothetical protein
MQAKLFWKKMGDNQQQIANHLTFVNLIPARLTLMT